mmetsp:Transcript_25842/g.56661  ORF Transcript_25842/g.56661 Transcript_25842/m.56661 type:complete len:691 (-) Transcript_25842:188-2260(-)|eukprot:CAMPEP_0168171312 /NCGR_PEP_ID=MMETSP0139_2-20121125/4640_1 /TAXON_ID=44445 /ORGANISM="Pseudo-nitzschia australis, Strain 10249 10 AB" /LENGTH=690 /DNA_ID=CAMNT_0008088861 /DNA_START=208 /DNA_END=2280 /DNA_ORIENTATION=+
MADAVLSSIISFLFPSKRGQMEKNPLLLKAVPGLITLLDVALFRSVEGQLTGTITSSHALLACWLDIKHQAQIVLQLYKTKDFIGNADGESCPRESLAWQCLEAACNAIERLSTDRLAAAANLSDAYEGTKASAVNNTAHQSGIYNNDLFYTASGSSVTGVGIQGIRNGILLSKDETGRRGQLQQRRKDCWESPRLFCPDYVWADDVYLACRKWIRSLDKHPLVKISYFLKHHDDPSGVDPVSLLYDPKTQGNNKGRGSGSKSRTANNRNNYNNNSDRRRRKQEQSGRRRSARYAAGDDPTYEEMETQIMILVQLVQNDLPLRLYQFRSAMESEVAITKRLYLVKCEYRAPFRAFLEAHQNLIRAPPMELVDHYLNKNENSDLVGGKSGTDNYFSPDALKIELQALLLAPELVELLSLEMEAEKLELDMGKALFPFTELARTLAHKRVYLESVPGIVEVGELPVLRETIRRLGYVLCRKGCSETSTGIRPILLDLLMVPRDDELSQKRPLSLYTASSSLEERIDEFLTELTRISTLVSETISPSAAYPALNVDISIAVAKGCTEQYDPELLKCQLLDWFAIVERQHLLHENQKDLPEEIRRAEMKLSIAGASHQSLKTARDSLKMLEGIRAERFDVLKGMVEEVCLREMNLYVSLTGPLPQEVLVLKETPSAPGLFGIPLEIAGETLPIG